MDAAAAAVRRARPYRGRPLVPPNYVSLRDLQELRLREKEERRRREEEEAEARRVREEQRKRQEEEEEAAMRRFVEERRRREEEAAARRARDAAAAAPPAPAPRPEMRASSSSSTSSFRNNGRARGGQRLVVVADRPPRRGECTAVKVDGATGGFRGQKGTDGGAAKAPPRGSFKAQNEGKGDVSAGMIAGPGEPVKPVSAPSHAGKPEEKRKEEASGYQGKSLGPARPKHRHQGKKGFDGRSTETAMTSSIGEAVEASPVPVVILENTRKSRPGDQNTETASASMPGKAAEASPPLGVKSDNKGKKKPSGGRQASMAPSSDLPDGKVEASGFEGTASEVSSSPCEQADAGNASYRMPLRPVYKRKGKKGSDGRSTETATTIVSGKATDVSILGCVNLDIKGNKGLIEQGTEAALARIPIEAADASLARGFKSENKGEKESSGGKHTGMAGMKAQPYPAAEGRGSHRSNGGQGATWEAKTEGLQEKQTVVEVNVQPKLVAESSSYLSSGDQGMIQAAKSKGSEEKQRVVEMRTTAQLKPRGMRNSGRQPPGGRRVNFSTEQHGRVWVPKAVAVPDSAIVGKFP
uniref:Uncharacterized protein n=1 Tax=Avena sativa TaxID=4498 RepID=A0ACD5WDI4_AVESA